MKRKKSFCDDSEQQTQGTSDSDFKDLQLVSNEVTVHQNTNSFERRLPPRMSDTDLALSMWVGVSLQFESVFNLALRRSNSTLRRSNKSFIQEEHDLDKNSGNNLPICDNIATKSKAPVVMNTFGRAKVARKGGATVRNGVDIDSSDVVIRLISVAVVLSVYLVFIYCIFYMNVI